MAKYTQEQYKALDWNKSNKLLSQESGIPVKLVSAARSRYAKGVKATIKCPNTYTGARPGKERKIIVTLEELQAHKDTELAKIKGCTRAYINLLRKKMMGGGK